MNARSKIGGTLYNRRIALEKKLSKAQANAEGEITGTGLVLIETMNNISVVVTDGIIDKIAETITNEEPKR